ncbi:MAG: YdhR family protein [Candidatus Hermodarchaeia archaeon]
MELLIFLFKSGLEFDQIKETSEARAEQYRKVPGLIQKYYVQDHETGRVGGVFVFDSKANLKAFKESALAQSTGDAYKFLEPPHTRVLEIAKVLRE